jgi:DNA-binding SARP family transcriptional activator
MSGWKVRLFGKFSLEHQDKSLRGIEARQVQELLTYLLIFRNRPQSRDVLSEVLWGNRPSVNSRKCLRQTLWRLQSTLRAGTNSGEPELLVYDTWVQFNSLTDLWLDIAEFEKVFDLMRGKKAQQLSSNDFSLLEYAASIYKGDLLEGWYQDWCVFERERYQTMHLMLLDKLVQCCELHQKYDTGVAYGVEILRHDHAYERAHRQLMRLYFLTGNRNQAIHQYEHCVKTLRDELGVEPSERTKQLYEQIRQNTFKPASFTGKKMVSKTTAKDNPALMDVLNRLEEVSETLSRLEHQVREEIAALGGTSSV